MKDSLRMRFGAVTLALVTVAAIIFVILNFQQRARFDTPDDGVSWLDTAQGVQAWHVSPDSPAARAGIRSGDLIEAVNGVGMHRAVQVTRQLWKAGLWAQVHYRLARNGRAFETSLVTVPIQKPFSVENYLRIVGLLYLFIGLFIFARRWSAARAVHFYIFCLVSFILYSFHYSGKLNNFDTIVYWANIFTRLLQPALLVHFALVFPERRTPSGAHTARLAGLYSPPAILLLLHVGVATRALGFVPWLGARVVLDQMELGYLGTYFLAAALIFLRSYRRAPSGVLRQQLKWVTGGTLAGIVPFFLLYILPFFLGVVPQSWMKFSAISQTLLVDRLALFLEDPAEPGCMRLTRSMGVRFTQPLDLSFLSPDRPAFARGYLLYESPRVAAEMPAAVRRTLEQLDLNYFIPCRVRERTVAVLGLGKTVDGDILSIEDVEL